MEPTAHYILCRSRTLLSRKEYADWREIQDEFKDYMASLGPWNEAEFCEYLEWDYGPADGRWPFRRAAIAALFRGGDTLEIAEDTAAIRPPDSRADTPGPGRVN